MRFGAALALVGVTIFPSLALADMPPPPPVPLTRRISASLAGLEFTRQLFRHWVPQEAPLGQGHPGGYGIAIFLTGCAPALPNCRLAKEKGVLNWDGHRRQRRAGWQ